MTEAAQLFEWMQALFALPRSITGDAIRDSIALLNNVIPLQQHEVASGTELYDWTVPNEWNPTAAWIKDSNGNVIVDYANHPCHLLAYSTAINQRMTLAELQSHLHSDPNQPDAIVFRTSYYQERWGFCLPQRQRDALKEDEYHVFIDAETKPGALTFAECFIPGKSRDEIILSANFGHPGQANDNLSGLVSAVAVARFLLQRENHFSYRLVLAPETIGPLAWLASNRDSLQHVLAGLVFACCGDAAPLTYKQSRSAESPIDRAMRQLLSEQGGEYRIREYSPTGGDERQFSARGFGLAFSSLMRSPYGEFPEYHTSLDDLNFIDQNALQQSAETAIECLLRVDANQTYLNTKPHGEPFLSRYDLYPTLGATGNAALTTAIRWVLDGSDGNNDLLTIANHSKLPWNDILLAAQKLHEAGLLQSVSR